jgi:deoxyribodipyrimidine photo-lyase
VVTDYFPTFIVPRQTRGLRRKTKTPVIAVESCTVVPLRQIGKAHSTARGIRPVLMHALGHFLFPVPNPEPKVRRSIELPFEPVVPTAKAIPALVAACDIDHTVPPSRSFRGGTRAGHARLKAFLKTGLVRYEERNDPNEPDAVSRLSPWLHFGNLSIHEILLAVMDRRGEAEHELHPYPHASLFVDQAVVWRELAHNFCHYDPKHRTVDAIPGWARKQLADHESDPRPHLYSMEEMEQARTGEELWNAAQRWYLHEGWMHNYMRMLWGKTVLQWTSNAAEALRVLEHLNNKYSLDGRDPNSYSGIFWIFGKFDRPFYPRPIYGNVRYMSLKAAKGKFDVKRYVAEAPS